MHNSGCGSTIQLASYCVCLNFRLIKLTDPINEDYSEYRQLAMEYYFIHSQAIWILSGISLVLPLLLMIFLIMNCSHCFRRPTVRADDTECLINIDTDVEQMQETALAVYQDQADESLITASHNVSASASYQVNHPDDQLTSDHLSELLNKLHPARDKWENIGIHLGMTDDLDAIKQGNYSDPGSCLREILKTWLRRRKATRQALVAALKSASVDYPDMATSLLADCRDRNNCEANDFSSSTEVALSSRVGFKCPQCGNCALQDYLYGKCPEADISSDSPFCCLDIDHLKEDEQIILYTKLINETSCITKDFSVVVSNLRQTLKQQLQNVRLSDIANSIFDAASCDSLTEPLQRDVQFDTEFSSIDKIINYLQKNKYISFINYRLLEDLVSKYGKEDETLQNALHTYQEKFTKFCERSVFEIPQNAYGTAPADGERLKFKVTDGFIASLPRNMQGDIDDELDPSNHPILSKSLKTLKLSLGETLTIQERVAEALGPALKNVGHLVFLGALKGCIELIFSAPKGVMSSVKPKLKNISTPTQSSIGASFANLEAEGIHILSGPPGKPKAINDLITGNSITLEWTEPEYQGIHPIQYYYVHYRSVTDPPGRWKTIKTYNSNTSFEIRKLPRNRTSFLFKLQAVSEIGAGIESETSDPTDLMKLPLAADKSMNGDYPSQPGKPRALYVTHDCIELEWTKPEQGADKITSYTILYRSTHDPHKHWIELKDITTEERVIVSELFEDTKYLFQVLPECDTYAGLESNISDHIRTKVMMPSKPGKPTALKVTHDSVLLQWTKPEQGAHNITSYIVFYQSGNDPPDRWIKHQVTDIEEALVSQLLESSVYYFKIRADGGANIGDIGIESNISNPIVTEMILPRKPGKPTVVEVTHSSIELEWTKPEYGTHNITSYTVLYRSTRDPPEEWIECTTLTERVLLKQLLDSTVYYFKIRPECEVGSGSESDISEPIETKMMLPSKPGKPKALVITDNHIQVGWTEPKQGTHNITSNIVFYLSTDDLPDQWNQKRVEAGTTCLTVNKLSEKTSYYFRVCSECKDGLGPISDTSEPITTKMILPSKPGKPRALKITENSIELEWTKPEYGAHNATSYTVLYGYVADPPDEWKNQNTPATNHRLLVSHLFEYTIYYFIIRPECKDNISGLDSNISDPIQTNMIIPSKPRNLTASNITHESVQLEWTKPEKGAHNITSYTVFHGSVAEYSWALKKTNSIKECTCISGLSGGTTYYFKVCAKCKAGLSLASDTLLISTPEHKPILQYDCDTYDT